MPERESPEDEKCKAANDPERKFFSAGFVLVVLLGLLILAVVASLSAYLYVQGAKDWISFLMASLLNALIFLAIVFQAFIYSKQWDTMRDSVREARRSAKIAEDAFHVGEAPYFGIALITPKDFQDTYAPLIEVTFTNGGKTPAWHFHSDAHAVIGPAPDGGKIFKLNTVGDDLHKTFWQAGDTRPLAYQHHKFRYYALLESDPAEHIFLIIKIHYQDFRKVWHAREFRLVWDWQRREFKDYEAEEERCKICKEHKK